MGNLLLSRDQEPLSRVIAVRAKGTETLSGMGGHLRTLEREELHREEERRVPAVMGSRTYPAPPPVPTDWRRVPASWLRPPSPLHTLGLAWPGRGRLRGQPLEGL